MSRGQQQPCANRGDIFQDARSFSAYAFNDGSGAAAGTLFATWASRFLVGFISTGARPVWLDLSLDWTVLGFTVAIATATGIIFGLESDTPEVFSRTLHRCEALGIDGVTVSMLTPLPGTQSLKPGCATQPMFGVQPVLLDEKGKLIEGPGAGLLVLSSKWLPGPEPDLRSI